MDQLIWKNLLEASGYVIAALSFVALMQIKKWFEGKKFFDASKMVSKNTAIRDLLIEARVSQDADRAKLFQFHNGDFYVSGESVMKLSMTHVVMASGVAYPHLSNTAYNSIPTSYLTRLLGSLHENDVVIVKTDELEDDHYMKHIFVSHGVKSSIMTIVKDAKNNWIGVIVCSWIKEVNGFDTDMLLASATKIGSELTKK